MASPVTFGSVVRQRRIAGAVLTEAAYPPGARVEPHVHDHPSMMWVAAGHLMEAIGARSYVCTATDVMWKQAGLAHTNRVGDTPCRVVVLELMPELLGELADEGVRAPDAPAHVSGAPAAMFARLVPSLDLEGVGALAAQELVAELLTAVGLRESPESAAVPPWLEAVRARVHDDPSGRVSLGALARDVGVHPVYLARTFRRYFGCSITEYLHGRRIDLAVAALASGEADIGRLAVRLGYYDHSHFSRTFARLTGLPPSAYRDIASDAS